MLGRSPSSDRSRDSSAGASEILRPARHSMRTRSLAQGLGAARIRASTWWASRYSGSFFADLFRPSASLGLGCLPPGSSVARDDGLLGCHGWAPQRIRVVRHLVRAIVSIRC